MISCLKGTIIASDETSITLDVSGIGFHINCPKTVNRNAGASLSILTHIHWNQENGPVLYGFSSEIERTVFLAIISCSGIGPKLALVILSSLPPALFLQAIQTNNEKALSAINGIGSKKAEQIISQLKYKIPKLLTPELLATIDSTSEHFVNLAEVLTSLNYTRTEVQNSLQYLRESATTTTSFDQLLRLSLAFLSKQK